MISTKMAQEINAQINREFFSAFLYLAMANEAMAMGFKGASFWFTKQFEEEQEHALKFSKYLEDQGAKVMLEGMEQPQTEWPDLMSMFKDALGHERKVTAWINDIYTLALEERDYATQHMLQWFIEEQVEEEASVEDVIWMLEMSQGSKGAMLMTDRQLGKREDD